mgnify:CR=1 FL=1
MEKSLFEQMGGTYTQQGDYILPNLTLSAEEKQSIGIWGQRHARYLKQHHKILYYNLLTSGKLNAHLTEIDRQAEGLFFRLVNQMAEREGVTEQLKAQNQMEWVGRMNNIRNRVSEIVYAKIIFSL